MIKAFWFLLKITALIAVVVWLADRPGSMRLEWVDMSGNDLVVNMHIGLFLVAVLAVVLLSIFIYQVIKTFVDFPKSLARYNEVKAREQGYKSLTLGLTAVAAGDKNAALKYAQKSRKLLAGDTGLPLLLEAQAARLDGREADAARSFAVLLEDKNASFLGVRGLLQSALDIEDYDTALELATRALKNHPHQAWILKIAYGLQVRKGLWDDAQKTLGVLEKKGGVEQEKAQSDKAALLTAQALEALGKGYDIYAEETLKKAVKAYPSFAPAVQNFVQVCVRNGERKRAIKAFEKAWKHAPHESLIPLWAGLASEDEQGDALKMLRWYERLLKVNDGSCAALIAAGQAAMDAGLWGEAREYLRRAEEVDEASSAALYKTLAELEERTTHDEVAAKSWLSMAVSAPREKRWVCRETGQVFDEWQAFVMPSYRFNTLEWREPFVNDGSVIVLDRPAEVSSLLDAPDSDVA